MTNPVNAGQISKELAAALKLAGLVLGEPDAEGDCVSCYATIAWADCCERTPICNHCAQGAASVLAAALLAEAGERAKLEAERNEERRMRIVAERMETLAERRASTEAERARGLEAQLERIRDICEQWQMADYKSGDAMNAINLALSQLPTPKKL